LITQLFSDSGTSPFFKSNLYEREEAPIPYDPVNEGKE
jgi:hypothetical protein